MVFPNLYFCSVSVKTCEHEIPDVFLHKHVSVVQVCELGLTWNYRLAPPLPLRTQPPVQRYHTSAAKEKKLMNH